VRSLREQTLFPEQVVTVHDTEDPDLRQFCEKRDIPFTFRRSRKSLTRRTNIGLAFATARVVVIVNGGHGFGPTLLEEVHDAFTSSTVGALLVRNIGHAPYGDLLAARRENFVYGPLDERFQDSTLAYNHWVYSTFAQARRRMTAYDGIRILERRDLVWSSPGPRNALRGLWFGWEALGTGGVRGHALAGAWRGVSRGDVAFVLGAARGRLGARAHDPYRGPGPYDERSFWEETTREYVRWEVLQPDAGEIEEMLVLTRPRSILEVGCGAGRNIRFVPPDARYVGFDLSMNLLQRAEDKLQGHVLGLVCGTATHLCFSSNAFDLVFADSTIQHVPPEKIEVCVGELVRVARTYLCLIEYTREDAAEPGFFSQRHCFPHDYAGLIGRHMDLVARREIAHRIQPAVKEMFLFRKRRAAPLGSTVSAASALAGCVTAGGTV
jgi:SAM-dependent methyltransferase